ncbi:uncharacterized protein CMU_042670 [Cryptosporidium muris RN66]|uniref:Transmembrane protein n=1 Tax=Cryptosporidium muris (strain RN66) TaxID=441375 RepID=B6AAF2_CRYMR|nr:uncharacterized protein CMU_042670 [Cryptosporidium muris RN66]EEA05193.1 hypothetical protein, conserved [Cryptosporidium muris RN66]|eukprot:XP_002139542.1 hypothetical protein [Cryptosporidium muris RN66]
MNGSTSTYVNIASSIGALESGIMATLSGGPSYFIPFAAFGWYRSNKSAMDTTRQLYEIGNKAENPSKLNIYDNNNFNNDAARNQYFWILIVIAVILGVIAFSLAVCLLGIVPDKDYKTSKRRRRRLIEDPNLSPVDFAITMASYTPDRYRYPYYQVR